MRALFADAWRRDKRGIVTILLLNVVSSLTGGISIVMLIPMLELMDISAGPSILPEFVLTLLQGMPYALRITAVLSLFMLLVLGKALLGRALSLKNTAFVEEHAYQMRKRLYQVVSTAPWEKLRADRQTDTINLFTSQASQVSGGVAEIVSLISAAFTAVVQLGIALWLSVPVTLLVVVCGGTFVLLYRGMFQRSRAFGDEMITISRKMYQELFNQLWGVKEVRTYGVQAEHARLFEEISAGTKDSKLRYARLRARPQLAFSLASSGLVCVIFLVCVLGLKMELGRMMVLVFVFTRLWPVFSGFYSRIQSIQTSVPAFEKLNAAFTNFGEEEMAADTGAELPFEHTLTFDQVDFTYEDGTEKVLDQVSFTLRQGTVTVLIGLNGAGKTTIADLMLGLLRPDSGQISVDGVPLSGENLAAWRKHIAYIPQYPWILNTSVRENLMRFHPNATEADLVEALKRAGAWEFVSKMPNGMDTDLGDQGTRLSGGERQRIVLARMLIGKPKLIVMDEATAAMDFENEAAVRRIVKGLCPQSTVLIIAHRAETVRSAEYALVLENGAITQQGAMADLLAQKDSYLSRLLLGES